MSKKKPQTASVYILRHIPTKRFLSIGYQLSVVEKTRERTRQVRYLKPHHNMRVEYRAKNKSEGRQRECYIYIKENERPCRAQKIKFMNFC